MADIGAYSENSKYTVADVQEIVEHANINGIVSDDNIKSIGPYTSKDFYVSPAWNDSLNNRDFEFRYSSDSGIRLSSPCWIWMVSDEWMG